MASVIASRSLSLTSVKAARHAAVVAPVRMSPSVTGRMARPSRQSATKVVAQAAPSTVKIVMQGRRLEVTEAIRTYVEGKISHALINYQQVLKQVDVTLSARGGDTGTHGKKQQKVEVTIHTLRTGVVRVEDSEESLYAAIDLVCDKIQRKMQKVKELAISKGKWPGHAGPHSRTQDEKEFEEYLDTIKYETQVYDQENAISKQFAQLNKEYPKQVMRTKVLHLDPMSVDEAIDAMEAIGHDFYVFREIETDSLQVLYKRQEEGYGLLIAKRNE